MNTDAFDLQVLKWVGPFFVFWYFYTLILAADISFEKGSSYSKPFSKKTVHNTTLIHQLRCVEYLCKILRCVCFRIIVIWITNVCNKHIFKTRVKCINFIFFNSYHNHIDTSDIQLPFYRLLVRSKSMCNISQN